MITPRKTRMLWRWARVYLWVSAAILLVLIVLSLQGGPADEPDATRRLLPLIGSAILIVMGVLTWSLWRPWVGQVGRAKQIVQSYGQGDYQPRLPVEDGTEIGELAVDLNWMAHQLQVRHMAERSRQQEQESVLSSMAEGVVAIDIDGCFINVNRAGRQMLDLMDEEVGEKAVSDFIRQDDLIRFIRIALAANTPMDADLVLRGKTDKHVVIKSNVLMAPSGERLGVLLVINDVTRMRHLENMRRDFVANVSHELKTPITSIKGFMETLLDGALNDPEHARKFLEIIARQADRLDAIIEDLLSLSRIEQDSERNEIALKIEPLAAVLHAANVSVQTKAADRGIAVSVRCPDQLTARINSPLLEQAVTNLVDNAVKYANGRGKQVGISAEETEREIVITVADDGPGIAPELQQRIFERFYRVDKSRSRQLGGTGLGLSIVKHIAQAHGGKVSVQSALGKGSTFRIHLPR